MEKSISSSFEISKLPDTSQPVVNTTNVSIGSNFSRNMPVDDYNFDEDLTIAHEKEMDLSVDAARQEKIDQKNLEKAEQNKRNEMREEVSADATRQERIDQNKGNGAGGVLQQAE